ncbi:hypothetical protein D3C81_1255190 [compost metagenome]
MPEGQWLAWLDRQLPQSQLARLTQCRAQVIGLAHRNTPGGQDQVDITQAGQALASPHQVIRQDAHVAHFTAQALQPADQQAAVAVVDLPRAQWQTWLDQLVAGGQHCHPYPTHHLQLSMAQGCGQPQFDRAQARSCDHHLFALACFLALRADILLRLDRFKETHPAILQHLGVFLHLDAVGTGRQRGAGEDPRARAGLQRLGRVPSKNALTDG